MRQSSSRCSRAPHEAGAPCRPAPGHLCCREVGRWLEITIHVAQDIKAIRHGDRAVCAAYFARWRSSSAWSMARSAATCASGPERARVLVHLPPRQKRFFFWFLTAGFTAYLAWAVRRHQPGAPGAAVRGGGGRGPYRPPFPASRSTSEENPDGPTPARFPAHASPPSPAAPARAPTRTRSARTGPASSTRSRCCRPTCAAPPPRGTPWPGAKFRYDWLRAGSELVRRGFADHLDAPAAAPGAAAEGRLPPWREPAMSLSAAQTAAFTAAAGQSRQVRWRAC